ncbi:MAG: putative Ig domain-containing protein, partial [Myxococcota bacterium]|nr:putative Ig domain-containing protein [Myxococcota bacterium]
VGETLELQLIASDAEGDPLFFKLRSPLPEGGKFDKLAGLFTWTPFASQAGSRSLLTFEVSDGELSAQETIAIEVRADGGNIAPVIEPIGALTAIAGERFAYRMIATDPTNDPLTFRLIGDYPAGLILGAGDGLLSWSVPADELPAIYQLQLSVSDGILESVLPFQLVVSREGEVMMNRAPRFIPVADLEVQTGQLVSFILEAEDETPAQLRFGFAAGSPLPNNASVDPTTGRFSWTPEAQYSNQNVAFIFEVSDGQLQSYQRVNIQVNPVERGCPPDPQEGRGPRPLDLPAAGGMTRAEGALCEARDEDRFRINVGAQRVLSITITFTHAERDIDVYLEDARGMRVAESSGVIDREVLVTSPLEAGPYTLVIYSVSGAANGAAYQIALQSEAAERACQDDDAEENDEDNASVLIEPYLGQPLQLCSQDHDFYLFDLEQGEGFTLRADFRHDILDIDLRLTLPNGELRQALGTGNREEISVDESPIGGRATLEVFSFSSGSSAYELRLDRSEAVPCMPDRLEPNDRRALATTTQPELYRGLIDCGDEDWYTLPLEAGRRLFVYITSDGPPPTVTLLDRNEQRLPMQQTALLEGDGCLPERSHCQLIRAEVPDGGATYIRVSGGTRGQEYDLRVRSGLELGNACESALDCNTPLECIGDYGSVSYSRGSCSKPCASNADCGRRGVCIESEGSAYCALSCGGDGDCPSVYLCDELFDIDETLSSVCFDPVDEE